MEQLTILPGATPEQREAAAMHFEIVQAAKVAANGLLDLGRKLKKMRDSGLYKALGFENFGDYTEAAVGIRQRQAYNYIQVVESLPAQLIEENAAAGVTKLALLAKLNPEDREGLTGDNLANITVDELKQLIKERDELSRQLSMFQDQTPEPVADVEAVTIDPDEIRRQAAEETRQQMEKEWEERRRTMEAEKADAVNRAALAAEKAAADAIRKAKEEAAKEAKAETKRQVAAARDQARQEATAENERRNAAELEAARLEAAEAREKAEALTKQLQLNQDEDGVRFALLFEQMRDKVDAMQAMAETMRGNGKDEEASRYMTALCKAMEAMLDGLKGGI